MARSIEQISTELNRLATELKERAPANKAHTLQIHANYLETQNKELHNKITTSNKSAGQYKSLYEQKRKECLRKQSEIDRLNGIIKNLRGYGS